MLTRYGVSIGSGLAVTFVLLLIMQSMIARDPGVRAADGFEVSPFVMVVPTPTVRRIPPRKPEPPETLRPPETPVVTLVTDPFTTTAVTVPRPAPPAKAGPIGRWTGVADAEASSLVKVQPQYPPQAISRGLEGYVIVEFSVTRTGETRDIRVVESSDRVFERSAIEAAARFRYSPRVVSGEPVSVSGVRNRISFVLNN